MSRKTDIQAINDRLATLDTTYNIFDRGQFYIEQYVLTGNRIGKDSKTVGRRFTKSLMSIANLALARGL